MFWAVGNNISAKTIVSQSTQIMVGAGKVWPSQALTPTAGTTVDFDRL